MAYLFDTGIFAANDSSGASLSGAKLTFYDNGTTTLKNTYPTKADAEAGTNANANPVVADANGRWGAIWLDDTFYTVKFQPADGSFTRTRDDIGGALADLASTASGKGAGLSGFSYAASYSAGTVGDWISRRPKDVNDAPYYAVAAGDDTTAMLALAASADTDIALHINSLTTLSAEVNFTDKNLSILGNGSAVSQIRCNTAGRLSFLCTDTAETAESVHRLNVKGVSVVSDYTPTAGNGETAIEAQWSYTGSGSIDRAFFEDVVVRGGGANKWWKTGIKLIDAPRVFLSNVMIYNQEGHQTNQANAAIEIVRDAASNVTGFFLNNFWLGRFQNGILVTQAGASVGAGTVEGHYFNNGEIVNVAYGTREDNTATASIYYDSIHFTNVHMNASRAHFKAGRNRTLEIANCNWISQNFGETSSPAPLEASVSILLQSEGLKATNNTLTRYDTITDDVAAFLLPDAASLNWARITNNQLANWLYVANVQSSGSLTELAEKLYIGNNTLIATPYLTDYGFRGEKAVIGGNIIVATGTVIDFGHTFSAAPAVSLTCRNGYVTNFRADSVGASSFTLVHDGAGSQAFSWTAVGL